MPAMLAPAYVRRVTQRLPDGFVPREFSGSPDGSVLYLTNFRSRTIEPIDVARL
jgi:DNA-binding beta-propeller fold protein YncE